MATTYKLISSVTVGSTAVSTIDFTSIPQTYTDLLLKCSLRTDRTGTNWDELELLINGSALSAVINFYGTGSSVGSDTGLFWTAGQADTSSNTSNTFSNTEIYFANYASTNIKTVSVTGVVENNATAALQFMNAGKTSGTAAITSISLDPYSTSKFVQYSTAYLYGIKNS